MPFPFSKQMVITFTSDHLEREKNMIKYQQEIVLHGKIPPQQCDIGYW